MQAIRQIIETRRLKNLIDIPEDFSSEKVEIIIFPVSAITSEEKKFNPEQFFAVSHLKNVDKLLEEMRDEWEH